MHKKEELPVRFYTNSPSAALPPLREAFMIQFSPQSSKLVCPVHTPVNITTLPGAILFSP